MNQDIAVPAALAGLISETQTREPYKHACRGKFTARVERANTRPYSSFGFRSNARWFLQTMPDGSKQWVSNTMFDPRELAVASALVSGIEAKTVDGQLALVIPVKRAEKTYAPELEKLPAPVADRIEISVFSAEKPEPMPREEVAAAAPAESESI